jgi:hypothetical protein
VHGHVGNTPNVACRSAKGRFENLSEALIRGAKGDINLILNAFVALNSRRIGKEVQFQTVISLPKPAVNRL